MMAKDKLDAIIYPTGARRAALIAAPPAPAGRDSVPGATGIANLSGFPDLIVPAGFTTDDLPVTVSFFGTAFSEPKLLALGYSFEQATHAIRRPVNTPALAGATIEVPDGKMAAAK
jgi:amidase